MTKLSCRNRNRWMITVAIILALASVAQANIGDSLERLVAVYGPSHKAYGPHVFAWTFNEYSLIATMNNGVSEDELFMFPNPNGVTPAFAYVTSIMEREVGLQTWHSVTPEFGSQYMMQNEGAGVTVMLRYGATNPFWIFEIGYTRSVIALAEATPATPSQPTASSDDRLPNDCAIIAAEAYKRLKPVTYWCEIMGVRAKTPAELVRHAMVFYKYQAAGNVIVYDARGSMELNTTSEKLEDLAEAIKPSIYSLVHSYPTKVELNPLTFDEAKSYHQSVTKTASATNKRLNDLAETIGYLAGWIMMKLLIGGGVGYLIGKSKNMPWFGFWWGFALGLVGWIVTVCMRIKRPVPA